MADSPGNEAAKRAEELKRRERELAAGEAITEEHVRRAAENAELARGRDQEAHRRELHRHYQAGVAHERAADLHELAIEEGLGDVAAHRLAAGREREAARRDFRAAQESDRQGPE